MFSMVVSGTSDCPAGSGPGKYFRNSGSELSKGALTFANFICHLG